MKRTLLFLFAFLATLPVLAQRNGIEYRNTKLISTMCDEEYQFIYPDEVSTNPICVKLIYDAAGISYVDSLYYNELGQIARIDKYYYDYGSYSEMVGYICFTYNEKGLKIKQETYSTYKKDGTLETVVVFAYDENDNMILAEQEDTYGYYKSKIDYLYNEDGLRTEAIFSTDEGEGYVPEELIRYEYENGLMVNEKWFLIDEGEEYLDSETIYVYDDHGNCIIAKELAEDGVPYWMTEYQHDLSVSYDAVYYFESPDEYMFLTPSHNNMIIGYTDYYRNDNDELEIDCEYEYEYDQIFDAVEENSIEASIYPNPVKDFINIEVENMDLVELYDIFGKRLYSEEENDNVQIDMNRYSAGIYFLKIYSEGRNTVEKIIKK